MSIIHVKHIKSALDHLYANKIDMKDCENKTDVEKHKVFYTRALAAYSLNIFASTSINDSLNSLTDCLNDNSIDAIFYNKNKNTIYFVHSQLIEDGKGKPFSDEISKFKEGIVDIIEEKYNKLNKKIIKKLHIIKEAFNNNQIKLNILLIYTGKGFSIHDQNNIISNLIDDLNESTEWVSFTEINLKTIHDTLNFKNDNPTTFLRLSQNSNLHEDLIDYFDNKFEKLENLFESLQSKKIAQVQSELEITTNDELSNIKIGRKKKNQKETLIDIWKKDKDIRIIQNLNTFLLNNNFSKNL